MPVEGFRRAGASILGSYAPFPEEALITVALEYCPKFQEQGVQ